MTFIGEFPNPDKYREAIEKAYRADETACVDAMPNAAKMDLAKHKRCSPRPANWSWKCVDVRKASAGSMLSYMNMSSRTRR